MKTCSKCDEVLDRSLFSTRTASRDGLAAWCKRCTSEYAREYRQKNAEKVAAQKRAWGQRNASQVREQKAEYRVANADRISASRKKAYRNNPEPARARALSRTRANPELNRERAAQWRKRNPERASMTRKFATIRRRARIKSLPVFEISKKDMRGLLSAGCAVPGCGLANLTIDHIIPIARGGGHSIGNLQMLCSAHNRSKSDRLWIEFRVYLNRKERLAA